MTVERDLLKERVNVFLHRLYAAKSEARTHPAQRDLFLNEAEALAPQGTPIAEDVLPEVLEVAAEISEQLDIVPQQVRVIQHPESNMPAPAATTAFA